MENEITLRPAVDEDAAFLYSVFASTRSREVADFGWPPDLQRSFLKMQFEMQSASYKMQLPDAEHSIILLGGKPAGRLIVNRTDEQISLTDISIAPEYQKRGIATHLLAQLVTESDTSGKTLILTVATHNDTAIRIYQAAGYVIVASDQFNHSMERPPAPSVP